MNKEELQQSYNIHWKAMAAAIDQMMGQTIATSTGFQLLSKEVLRRTGKTISPSTLKRLYGYIHEQVEPRESTLDVLALFVGYGNWARFCQMQEMQHQEAPSSGYINARRLDVSELPIHSILRLSWSPDRVCSCLYRGDFKFEVLRSENTRLVPGTTFSCALILADQPLVLDQVCIGGTGVPAPYSIGRTFGVQFDLIVP